MVKHQYPVLFKEGSSWQERAKIVSGKIFELTEYLVDVLGVEDVGTRFPGKVTYHDSCHLFRNLHVAEQPRKLIANIKDIELIEMKNSEKCCGFGGAYLVSVARGYVPGAFFWETLFDRTTILAWVYGLFRTAVFGGAIALVSYAQGAEEKRSSEEVGRSTTAAVVAASLAVIGLDFVLTFLASFH